MTLYLKKQLEKRGRNGNLRLLQTAPSLIDFSSNDTLGLSRSSKLSSSVLEEWSNKNAKNQLNGLGSTGSRLLTGNSAYAENLEDKIAKFHGYEAGQLFSCGYMANVGLLSAIANEDSIIFFDAEGHASTIDGIRLSRAKAFPFRHNDVSHLEKRLQNCSIQGNRLICIESIYSTDGSTAPLHQINLLAKQYNAHLIVDEAHAVGVYGPNGRGLVAEHHLTEHVFAQVVTFGKALGTYGAIVLGSNNLKQALINFATSYIYTTALPFHTLAAIKCSYDLFPTMEKERIHIQKLIQIFHESYRSFSTTHIQPIYIEGNENVKQAALAIANLGYDVKALMSPTVKQGNEILRFCLHAFNTENEISTLLNHLQAFRSSCYA